MSNCFGVDSRVVFAMAQNMPKRPPRKMKTDSAEKMEVRRKIEDRRIARELGINVEDLQ